jgi:hypothetical protein
VLPRDGLEIEFWPLAAVLAGDKLNSVAGETAALRQVAPAHGISASREPLRRQRGDRNEVKLVLARPVDRSPEAVKIRDSTGRIVPVISELSRRVHVAECRSWATGLSELTSIFDNLVVEPLNSF